jgi:predicted nucleotidyltransferase
METLEAGQNKNSDAILFFTKNLKSSFSDNLIQVVLFGSQARGDSTKDSDYDFLIILKKKDKEFLKKLRAIELNFMDTFDSLAACLVYEEAEWEKRKNFPIGKNIHREGIIL